MNIEHIFGLLGTALSFSGYVPYFIALRKKTAKPHAFSWLLWAFLNAVVFAAQITEDGGAGAWAIGVCAGVNLLLGLYALKYGEKNMTRGDWIIFIVSLASIPLWMMTKDPLYSVLLVSAINMAGFVPTIRKSWAKPHEEVALTFLLTGTGFLCSIAALENLVFVNYFYPLVIGVADVGFVLMLWCRRRHLQMKRT